jgi:hypothetical protein
MSYRNLLQGNTVEIVHAEAGQSFLYINGEMVLYGDPAYWKAECILALLGAETTTSIVETNRSSWTLPRFFDDLKNRITKRNKVKIDYMHRDELRAGHLGDDGMFYCDEEEQQPSQNTHLYVAGIHQ